MSAVETSTACVCGSIGAAKELRRCDEHHTYWLADRRLDSVTGIIKKLFPTDYSKVDPVVLATAQLRGIYVDTYFSEYLTDPWNVLSLQEVRERIEPTFARDGAKYAADTATRIERLIGWWEGQGVKAKAVQGALYSEADGIAGTFDVATDEFIYDVKCTAEIQPNYALQVGSYLSMDKQQFPLRDGAVIHVTKDKVKLHKYDSKKIREQWKSCAAWWNTLKELERTA